MKDLMSVIDKYGTGIASIDTILTSLRGYFIPVNSSVERDKVIINICIPFLTGTKQIKTNIIHISKNWIQETPLTSKWRPDTPLFNKSFAGEVSIFKDQIALVNSKAKHLRSIQSYDTIEIKPEAKYYKSSSKDLVPKESESDSPDLDLLEANDVSHKMQIYNVYNSDYSKSRPSSIESHSISKDHINFATEVLQKYSKHIVFVDDEDQCRKMIEETKTTGFNFTVVKDASSALKVCENLLKQGKEIKAIFIDINGQEYIDESLVEAFRKTEITNSLCICGMSYNSKDYRKCLEFGMNEFCKIYLVLKPFTSTQLKKIITS